MTAKRIILRTLLALFVLTIALSSFLAWLLLTASGLSFAAHQAERFVPGFRLEDVRGDWSDLTATGFALEIPGVRMRADKIRFGLQWRDIAQGRIHVSAASVSGIDLEVKTAELAPAEPADESEEAAAAAPLTLPAGWVVLVDRAAVGDLRAEVDGMRATLSEAAVSLTWTGDTVTAAQAAIEDAAFAMPGAEASLSRLAASGAYSFDPQKGLVLTGVGINGVRATADTRRLAGAETETAAEVSAQKQGEQSQSPLEAPFAMKLQKFGLGDVAVEIDGSRFTLASLHASGEWMGQSAVVTQAAISGVRAELAKQSAETPDPEPAPESVAEPASTTLRSDAPPAVEEGLGEWLEKRLEKPLVTALPAVKLPIALEVRSFEAADVVVSNLPGTDPKVTPGIAPLVVTKLSSAFSLAGSDARLQRLLIESSAGTLDFSAEAKLAGSWPIAGSLEVKSDWAYFTNTLGVPSAKADFSAKITGEVLTSLRAEAKLRGAWSADFTASAGLGAAGLPFEIELAAEELLWPLPGAAAAPAEDAKKPEQQIAEKMASEASSKEAQKEAPKDSAQAVRPIRAADLQLSAKGSLKAWTLSGGGVVEAADLALGKAQGLTGTLTLKGEGTASRASISEASFRSPWGSVQWTAQADWRRGLHWQTALKADGFDSKTFFPKLPMKLRAEAAADGEFSEDFAHWRAAVTKLDVAGDIAGAPLGLTGAASLTSERQAALEGIRAVIGKNTIALDGRANDLTDVSLRLEVDAPGFINSLPGLRGEAKGYVNLSGSIFRPAVEADLRAKNLGWKDVFSVRDVRFAADVRNRIKAIESGAMKAKADAVRAARARAGFSAEKSVDDLAAAFAMGELSGKWSLSVKDIDAAGEHVDSVELGGEGDEAAHKAYFKTAGGIVSGGADVTGRIDRDTLRWQGTLARAAFETPVGPWSLERPASLGFDYPTLMLTLGAQCWANPDAEICLPKAVSLGRSGSLRAELKRLDMRILKPFLRRRDQASGTLTGSLDAKWDLGKPGLPDVKAVLLGDGLHAQTRYQGVAVPVTFEKLRVSASVGEDKAEALLHVKPLGNGDVGMRLEVADPAGARTLDGRLLMTDVTPSLLKPFLSQGEKAEGRMSADLRFGGTIERPELTGEFRLTDLQLDAAFIPVDMKPSDIVVDFSGQRSTLKGRIETAQGAIDLTGEADWRRYDDWRAKVGVKTEKIRASMPPMIKVDVVSDVWAEATPSLLQLGGRVDVPWADITVGTLPDSGVSISGDEVILDDDLKPAAPPSSPMAVKSNIVVVIGPHAAIAAFGLKAGLKGSLVVVQDGDLFGLNGQIQIPYGRFHAYGQDLIVTKGTAIFSGPAGNPTLNIEAIRNPEVTEDDVTAGIRVTGPASQPKVAVFTDPAKSQTEALSYLVRGQGLDTEDGSSNAMTSMLIGLGAATGSGILSEVGDAMGIEGLGLDTAGVGDSQQVVVSGYVLPGLQVKYGIGVFDSLATLTLRYRLMPRLYLEAVSSVDQALDLLYRFDF